MAIYFLRGRLPWQGLKAKNSSDKNRLIMESKKAQDVAGLCAGLPEEFDRYMTLVKNADREKLPDHDMLREWFRKLGESEGMENDNVFDWTVRMYLQQTRKH